MSVAEKFERTRHDVLDLTFRNPLLNFRVLRAKGLKIIDEIPHEGTVKLSRNLGFWRRNRSSV